MIDIHKVIIGAFLRTNKGEIIKVESISTKHQHRKVGYHAAGDATHIKYVRLGQVEGIELTPEILAKNFGTICSLNILSMSIVVNGITYLTFRQIQYVHELQAALYACDRQDLAEGFQV